MFRNVPSAACAMLILTLASAQAPNDASAHHDAPIAGDWRGQSVCQVKPSGCHDEESLYHVVPEGTRPGAFALRADKIVDGKPVSMGTIPCSYDAGKHSLFCTLPGEATLQFEVRGSEMQGVMKMQDGTLWRKISLRKVP